MGCNSAAVRGKKPIKPIHGIAGLGGSPRLWPNKDYSHHKSASRFSYQCIVKPISQNERSTDKTAPGQEHSLPLAHSKENWLPAGMLGVVTMVKAGMVEALATDLFTDGAKTATPTTCPDMKTCRNGFFQKVEHVHWKEQLVRMNIYHN